jgi:hypothetical protein
MLIHNSSTTCDLVTPYSSIQRYEKEAHHYEERWRTEMQLLDCVGHVGSQLCQPLNRCVDATL